MNSVERTQFLIDLLRSNTLRVTADGRRDYVSLLDEQEIELVKKELLTILEVN